MMSLFEDTCAQALPATTHLRLRIVDSHVSRTDSEFIRRTNFVPPDLAERNYLF
jgi:hypothetical protein